MAEIGRQRAERRAVAVEEGHGAARPITGAAGERQVGGRAGVVIQVGDEVRAALRKGDAGDAAAGLYRSYRFLKNPPIVLGESPAGRRNEPASLAVIQEHGAQFCALHAHDRVERPLEQRRQICGARQVAAEFVQADEVGDMAGELVLDGWRAVCPWNPEIVRSHGAVSPQSDT